MTVEYLGLFGFSSWEKILSRMQHLLKKSQDRQYINQFWKNERIIKNLDREYIALQARGYPPAEPAKPETAEQEKIIAKKLNIPKSIVSAYFQAIHYLSAFGQIPYSKYDPSGYSVSKKLQEKFDTEKGAISKITSATNRLSSVLIPVAVLATIGTGFFIYNKLK